MPGVPRRAWNRCEPRVVIRTDADEAGHPADLSGRDERAQRGQRGQAAAQQQVPLQQVALARQPPAA